MSTPQPVPDRPSPDGGPIDFRAGRFLALAAGAGLIAGLLAWMAGEASFQAFRPPTVRTVVFGNVIDKADYPDRAAADLKNAILAYAELGGLLGLALGLAGGITRGSSRAATTAGALGAIIGSVLGAVAAAVALPFYFQAESQAQEELSRDLVLPLLVHVGAWSASGLAGGVALGLGSGPGGRVGWARAARMAIGGLIGAAAGAVTYELVGAIAFPAAKTGEPISRTWATRLLARLSVAVLAAIVASLMAESRPGRKAVMPARPQAGPSPAAD